MRHPPPTALSLGSTSVALASGDDLFYEISPSRPLPTIDLSRSVRSALFRQSVVKTLNRLLARSRAPVFFLLNTSVILAGLAFSIDPRHGKWLALPAAIGALSAMIVQVLLMRLDIMALLLRTYEFWFFSVINTLSAVHFAMVVRDLRVAVIFALWAGHETNLLIDASITSTREFLVSMTWVIVFECTLLGSIALDLVDGVDDFLVLEANGYELRARDLILNGWSTVVVVLVRSVYRRRAAWKEYGALSTVVQCMTLQCRVRLRGRRRRRSASSVSSISSITNMKEMELARPTASYFENAKMVQLRCQRVRMKINAKRLLVPVARRLLAHPDPVMPLSLRVVVLMLLGTSTTASVLSFHSAAPAACRVLALVLTMAFCCFSWSQYQRQLLTYLVFSFDFAFVSIQFTVVFVSLCDLYRWDSRVYALAAAWCWVHWVLTFDCMTPIVKVKWGFRYRFVAWMALLFIVGHALLAYQIGAVDRGALHDRAIVSFMAFGRPVEMRVLPVMVSRLSMTLSWSCRIFLRLLNRHDHELIVIQGTVSYINNRKQMKAEEARARGFLRSGATTSRTRSAIAKFALGMSRTVSLAARKGAAAPGAGVALLPPASVLPQPSALRFPDPPPGLPNRAENPRLTLVRGQVFDAAHHPARQIVTLAPLSTTPVVAFARGSSASSSSSHAKKRAVQPWK